MRRANCHSCSSCSRRQRWNCSMHACSLHLWKTSLMTKMLVVLTCRWSIYYSLMKYDLCSTHGRVKKVVFSYSLPSVWPGADPGIQAVIPQVTLSHLPGSRLPLLSARPAVTFPVHRPVPNNTAWRQRHMRVVSSLTKAVTWKRTGRD